MGKYTDLIYISNFTLQIKLLFAIQLLIGIGSGYYAENVIISREKTELLWSEISENSLYRLQIFRKNVYQSIMLNPNQIAWKIILSNYEVQILEKLKQQTLIYLTHIAKLQKIFVRKKNSSNIESRHLFSLIG